MARSVKGFTMIELAIVIAIIAIVSTFAVLNAASWLRESRVKESRDRLVADLEQIKLRSMTGLPQAIFVVGETNSIYSIRQLVDNDNFVRDAGEGNTIIRSVPLSQNLKIRINNGDELWFDRKGVPRTAGWGVQGRNIALWYDSNGNNNPDSGEYAKEVVLSSGGRIRYEN